MVDIQVLKEYFKKLLIKEHGLLRSQEVFRILSPDKDFENLLQWNLPPWMLYTGKAWRELTKIDEDLTHAYTILVNIWLSEIFLREWSHLLKGAPNLKKCLSKLHRWRDIWTWNWYITNRISYTMYNNIFLARITGLEEYVKNNSSIWSDLYWNDIGFLAWKPILTCCDLSSTSLKKAENIARWEISKISDLFKLEYVTWSYETLLQGAVKNGNELITAFNMFSNNTPDQVLRKFNQISKKMRNWDVFIPSFFRKPDDVNYPSILEMKCLYDNDETRDRCVNAFCDTYKIPKEKVFFSVKRIEEKSCIQVSLLVSSDTKLSIPLWKWDSFFVKAWELSPWTIIEENPRRYNLEMLLDSDYLPEKKFVKFTCFDSYRWSKNDLKAICDRSNLWIDKRLTCTNWVSFAPILYKK